MHDLKFRMINFNCDREIFSTPLRFDAQEWKSFDEAAKQIILMEYSLAYCGYGEVNWCEALGTVLANDEVINGVSERGGYPVVKKKLRQWYMRITEYADRLLEGLKTVDYSDAMKEMQSNWIGKSVGAEIQFELKGQHPETDLGIAYILPVLTRFSGLISWSLHRNMNSWKKLLRVRSGLK